uniref:Uncharacterized protein n=1 Tax=Nelumbo nucifera TaxID=4432 RepID=A0A822ZQ77_NELNU|nr:TPA_asm: hypothetical protein HUJ06_016577 [Nelumbo nucifera]
MYKHMTQNQGQKQSRHEKPKAKRDHHPEHTTSGLKTNGFHTPSPFPSLLHSCGSRATSL